MGNRRDFEFRHPEGFGAHSQDVHSKHPPDKEYGDDGPSDVDYPVANGFRFSEIKHAAMVAGSAQVDGTEPAQRRIPQGCAGSYQPNVREKKIA